ncbi:RNA polymerase sigma-70 factor, ECF subfamily [Mucilaginibacter lappiensis]|uniref:RNA polymerase sigma-70 factor (ECF subfamily) n=1 Tax=Mucilaginibacter lappiensis TaxID=354630 RepID=A0ABR6PCY4_9SPHI|nr:RNA polymerase sigma-70 factor [Mucilaginibacter lappiensis]MBB6107604.1 RNA polymerase sigma-70 factor (ECF subfamily) [Mucilaginibacter lappiensis]SIQ03106.1 RNA polymerase sigma-70 factor, ECF subfamily [Mucilaginibacter lappiensis]
MSVYIDLNDFDLVALIKEDDHGAYREIYHRYTGILYTHAYSKLQDREEAKDVVQDVFSSLWSKRATIEFQVNISGYLYTSLRNKILNIIAHKKIESDYADSLQAFLDHGKADTDYLTRTNQLQAIVENEVANMPPKMREIFELSRKKHFSRREIALELGISEKTVKNQINNALKVLRVKLGILNYLLFLFF